jgi:hypothetical protein
MLNHFITEQDFLTKEGQDILFYIVVYDLTEDGVDLMRKILNTGYTKYLNQQAVTGFLTAPAAISTISAYNTIGVSYTINSGPDDLGLFDWTITKSISGAALQ